MPTIEVKSTVKTSQWNWSLISAASEGRGDVEMGGRKDSDITKPSFY